MRVLILNHTYKECGIFQFGKRVYELASRSDKIDYFYREVGNKDEYLNAVNRLNPEYIVYNYHWDRMPWLAVDDYKNNINSKHYFIWHDGSMIGYYDKYLFFGYDFIPLPKDVPSGKAELLARPLFDYKGSYPVNLVPTIGSFGFCSDNKRFPGIVKMVCNSFNQATVNLHITRPWFGDKHGYNLDTIVKACMRSKTNPNVTLNITTNFLNDDKLLEFLAGNDINVFYYEGNPNSGLSAATDYALSVKRPIAVTRASLLRHIYNKDNCLEKNSITGIMNKGLKPLARFHSEWDTNVFVNRFDNIFRKGK